YILHLFLERSAYHLDLNSFPTRRSSDLIPKKQLDLYLKVPIVKTIVKNKILKGLGLNQCKIVATGAAITPAFLKEFYKKLDIHLIEAYGMTELCGSITNSVDLNSPYDSVGKVVPFAELKIDP